MTLRPARASVPINVRPILPLHHRVYTSLSRQIIDGVFSLGARLPGENELCATFDVSRVTIRRAILRLESDGLVVRQRGAGTFVRYRPGERPDGGGEAAPLARHLEVSSADYATTRLAFEYVPTPARLNAGPHGYGAVVLRIVRLARVDGQPVHLHTTLVPERHGRHLDATALGSTPIVTLLRAGPIDVGDAELLIGSVNADAEQARLLEVEPGAALISAVHLFKGADGSPLEYTTTVSRPDLFRYRFRSDEAHGGISPISGL